MHILIITDPLTTTFGSVRPPLLLSREIKRAGYEVTIVSTIIDPSIASLLESFGVQTFDMGLKTQLMKNMPTLEHWFKLLLGTRRMNVTSTDESKIINFSSTIMTRKRIHIYYAQGPMVEAIRSMKSDMPWYYTIVSMMSLRFLEFLEERTIREFRRKADLFIANSQACKFLYEKLGVKVDDVIYPPLDVELFKPSTSRPSANYILTYFGTYGKETRYKVVKRVADKGVKIKAFGGKAHYVPKYIARHPNIEILGYVNDEELIKLYSNALYTIFVFNHEPFGYIPVESMACGTPVLTYNKEGPSETILHGVTGWLANNDEEIVEIAYHVWKNGYPQHIRADCRKRAMRFDAKIIASKWLKLLEEPNY